MAIALNKRKVKSTAKLKNAKHNEWMWGYILVAPTVIGLLILNLSLIHISEPTRH